VSDTLDKHNTIVLQLLFFGKVSAFMKQMAVLKSPCENGILEVFIIRSEFAEPHVTNLERYFMNCFTELTLNINACM
jgi:hypothetical protein